MKPQASSDLPWIVSPEIKKIPLSGWRFRKPVVNGDICCHCGLCYLYCPTGCIVDRVSYFETNLEYCKGCGICAEECPTRAITMQKET